MKLLFENWRKYLLTEATDLLQSRNGNIIIFADWAKGHIVRGHKEPGKGSIFAEFDLTLIGNAVSLIDVDENNAVYTVNVPNVGYDLVLPMREALLLPDAQKVDVSKEERDGEIIVTGIQTSEPLESFLQDKLSVVIRPTTSLEYVPDDIKEQVATAVEQGRAYSVLSAWPGRGDVPPSSQWENKWAVVIPAKSEELEEYAVAPANLTRMGDKDTPQTKPLKFGEEIPPQPED